MKKIFLLLVILGFTSIVHASTNCSTGCDVDGATFFDANIDYINWDNPAHDASLKIKAPNGGVVATKSTGDIVNWGTSQLIKFYPQVDGNYTLEVFSQGIDNNYQLKLDFNSLGTPSTYQDTNCTGTGCGGSTKIYKMKVSNSPTPIFDDNKTIPFSVKGGTVIVASVRFLDGAGCSFSNCNVSIAVRRLSDNNVVAYADDGDWLNWNSSSKVFDWNVTNDGNYALEVWYEGAFARYDLNFSFTDSTNTVRNLSDYSQWIGSGLATGNTSQYFFNTLNSPAISLIDETAFTPQIKGGTILRTSFRVYEGSGCSFSTCNVSLGIRRLSDNNVVAYVDDGSWTSWSNTPKVFDWNVNSNDNYALEVWYEGGWAQYDLNVTYADSSGIIHHYSTYGQYTGGSLSTGNTSRYLFEAINTQTILLSDEKTFTPPVKGGSLFKASFRITDGSGCSFSTCNVSIGVRRLSDNNVVAYIDDGSWTSWSSAPRDFNWWADYEGNFALEIWYEGGWSKYDLNVFYVDVNSNTHLHSTTSQYTGSSLTTSNTSRFLYRVTNSPPVLLDDGETFLPAVKGNTLFTAAVRFRDGSGCSFSTCNASIGIRRLSDNNVVAYEDDGSWTSWANTPRKLQWWADEDDSYSVEVWYEGGWSQYDLNVNYVDESGTPYLYSDNYHYTGSSLSTGNISSYFFIVDGSPSLIFSDGISTPYKTKAGVPFFVKLRMYDGSGCSFSECDANFAIKDTNGSTVASLTTGGYTSFNNVTLQFKPINDHEYFIETWYQGGWVHQDLNIDFQDTADINRHLEDKFQYVGSSLTTGVFSDYYFGGGPSCGDGVYCPQSACVPLILNGPSELTFFQNPAIDIVFSGSGFSDRNGFRSAIEFLIDYNGSGDGLFSYEPFKTYKQRFNVWMVDQYNTYDLTSNSGYWKFANPLLEPSESVQRQAMDNCPHGNEFVVISAYPRFRSAAANVVLGGDPIGTGGHFAQLTVGCEILGTCPYPVDANYFDPYTSYCDGNATLFKTAQFPTVGCDNVADSPSALQRLFVHEFGHSFGGLADEYLINSVAPLTNFAPNCDANGILHTACDKWNNYNGIACVPGCSYPAWYRPYENSIMKEHRLGRYEYGEVSEAELEKDIAEYNDPLFGSYDTFIWGISYQNGGYQSYGATIVDGVAASFTNQPSPYRLQVFSDTNLLLMDSNILISNQLNFEPTSSIFDENGNQVSMPDINILKEFDDVNFFLPIPGFSNAATARLYDNGIEKLSINLLQEPIFSYSIGYGGGMVTSTNYKVQYSITPQPSGKLTSVDYNMQLGWITQ